VQASRYYTREDDGLTKKWCGKVYLNPPYADALIGKFIKKLCNSFAAGHVPEAIVLVNNATETRWFRDLANHSSIICFPRGRVRFLAPDGIRNVPLQGQAVCYLGKNREGFTAVFRRFGVTAEVIKAPRKQRFGSHARGEKLRTPGPEMTLGRTAG
jgi:hypothetical protein